MLTRRSFAALSVLPLLGYPARSLAHTATPPSVLPIDAVRSAIEELLMIEGAGDLAALMQRIHPNALQSYPGFVIAHWFRSRPVATLEIASDPTIVDLDTPIVASPAADAFPGAIAVASYVEVEITQAFIDGTTVTAPRRYTQVGDDIVWIFAEPDADPAAALEDLRAAGMQTDFQLVSFPQQDIDIETDAPATWESFTRQETGSFTGDDTSGYATYTSADSSATSLVYSWQRLPDGALPGLATWYAITAAVPPMLDHPGSFITAPDLKLDVFTADDSFARVLAPSSAASDGAIDDRAVYAVSRDGSVWLHSIAAFTTEADVNLCTNFAASLPFVAV